MDWILSSSGFINVSIQPFNAMFKVDENLNQAVKFLSSIGPASIAIGAPEVDENTQSRFASTLADFLGPYIVHFAHNYFWFLN